MLTTLVNTCVDVVMTFIVLDKKINSDLQQQTFNTSNHTIEKDCQMAKLTPQTLLDVLNDNMKKQTVTGSTTSELECNLTSFFPSIQGLSYPEVIELFPSNELIRLIHNRNVTAAAINNDNDSKIDIDQSIFDLIVLLVLFLLCHLGKNATIGRHIIRNLAPFLLEYRHCDASSRVGAIDNSDTLPTSSKDESGQKHHPRTKVKNSILFSWIKHASQSILTDCDFVSRLTQNDLSHLLFESTPPPQTSNDVVCTSSGTCGLSMDTTEQPQNPKKAKQSEEQNTLVEEQLTPKNLLASNNSFLLDELRCCISELYFSTCI